jgi:hypothetical protein
MATTARKRTATTKGRKPVKRIAPKGTATVPPKKRGKRVAKKASPKKAVAKKPVAKKTAQKRMGKPVSSSARGKRKPAFKKPTRKPPTKPPAKKPPTKPPAKKAATKPPAKKAVRRRKSSKSAAKKPGDLLSNNYPMIEPHGVVRSEKDLISGVYFFQDMDSLIVPDKFDYVALHLKGPIDRDSEPSEALIRTACKVIEHGKPPDGALAMLGIDPGMARKWFLDGAENPDSICGAMVRSFITASEWREYRLLGLLMNGIKFGMDVRWLLSKFAPERWGEEISRRPDSDLVAEDLKKKFLLRAKEEVQNQMSIEEGATMLCLIEQIVNEGGSLGINPEMLPKGSGEVIN